MKKILLLIVIAFIVTSCGPSMRELEEKRITDSIQSSVNLSTTEEAPEFNVTYYQDDATGIVFAVMQCCGETKIEIVPANQMGVKLNNCKNKIKSNL